MANKKGTRYTKRTPTNFMINWGWDVQDFAKAEHTTPDAIHMRVMRFGTPLLRKATPNIFEEATGRNHSEICERLNLNRKTVFSRFVQFGDPFIIPRRYTVKLDLEFEDGVDNHPKHKFWLHPEHPQYQTERKKWIPFLHKLDPDGSRRLIELYGDL